MKKKSLTELISELKGNENVVNWHEIEPREARTRPMPERIDERLKTALSKRGIDALYTHQYAAFQYVQKGESIVTVTPTASGKTLCYNLPVLQSIAEDDTNRALYLFPTKALAQDQKVNSMKSLMRWALILKVLHMTEIHLRRSDKKSEKQGTL